ncbi:hypothetical protein BDZ91DRAFT_709762 [Kalaharituber pfeilii]|nr:hypothetical protein BDZ91DRAFT_709762 [Kalaharituber pfeilii]
MSSAVEGDSLRAGNSKSQISTPFVIGISGCSSSGKTTLARFLRQIFSGLTVPTSLVGSESPTAAGPATYIAFTVTLLHQDDFFLPESALPVRSVVVRFKDQTTGLETEEKMKVVDWDFPGAVDFVKFKKALQMLRDGIPYGEVIGKLGIQETEDLHLLLQLDENEEGIQEGGAKGNRRAVSEDALKRMRNEVVARLMIAGGIGTSVGENDNNKGHVQLSSLDLASGVEPQHVVNIIIVDGFMLYHPEEPELTGDINSEGSIQTQPSLISLLDLPILLRTTYAVAKHRRESRKGYFTADGFWEDPKGYFDAIVWPSYVKYYQHLFVDGDVESAEGLVDEWGERGNGKGMVLQPANLGETMEGMVKWACERVVERLTTRLGNYW